MADAVEYVHAECGAPIRFRDDGDGHTTYVCDHCAVELGFFQDLGTVDLQAIRDSDLNQNNRFVVFSELPPG